MPRAERERQMLTVAEEIFAARGFVATSMDEIAERVGVSKPMLYEYFGSKEGLLIGTIRQARAELRRSTEEAVLGAIDIEDALRKGLVAFFEFITNHRQAWSLLRNEGALMANSAGSEVEQTRQQQTNLMTALMQGFAPTTDEKSREAAAEILLGACERLATWCEHRDEVTPAQAAEYIMRGCWYGMLAEFRGDAQNA
ncbi:TetR/AcrR family transcriptional regulator [Sciscionella sediminilitoris]|uniref:TetR/AcrR family transcriptional regulator n=1 Tax=Sciscionella sediminilitoris TaxID=1445613 RepID=UPI0004DF918A|nr:TetR/AcrR family transcriptional regulator [Sciscionella sp. SE31]